MLFQAFIVLVLFHNYSTLVDAQYAASENGQSTSSADFSQFLENAKQNYVDGFWNSCTKNALLGLEDFEDFARDISHCHQICSRYESLELDGLLKKGLCLRQCKKDMRVRNFTVAAVRDYVELKPYEFLHVCAYKIGNVSLAASSAYTYYLLHKTDDVMLNNIHFYRLQDGVTVKDFVNLEECSFVDPYIDGALAYSDEHWIETIEKMELATGRFYADFGRCEALCEETETIERGMGFHEALADRHIAVMRCGEACFTRITDIRSKIIADVLSDMYNYLQFAYFKVGRIHDALQCADTFLIFKPTDEDMINNKNYYISVGAVSTATRQDAVWFHQHLIRLATSLAEVEETYDQNLLDIQIPTNLIKKKSYKLQSDDVDVIEDEIGTCRHDNDDCAEDARILEEDITHKRLVANQIVSEETIDKLLVLMKVFGLKRAIRNVTTPSVGKDDVITLRNAEEHVYDLSLDRIVMLHRIGKFDLESLRLVVSTAEKMQNVVTSHLSPETPTYIRDIGLVRRQIKLDNATNIPLRPVEPCHMQESGICRKKGAYQNDTFLMALYLNKDFTGGQITIENFLLASEKTYDTLRGHLVAFSTINDHVVSPLQPGDRYTVYLSLTGDRISRSIAYAQASALTMYPTRRVQSAATKVENQSKNSRAESRARVVAELQKEGVAVEDLGVWDRFQADGLADQKQCEMLMNLAKVSLKNDGYQPGKELGQVHTEHEYFSGITIDNAAKLAEKSQVSEESVTLYQNMSEICKDVVQRYFQLPTPLYFDYTHLVCRTARNDSNKDRDDLSHPVHSDNCIIYSDGTCKKEAPAYTERDYSAILYLNDDFEGGEFVFTNPIPVAKDKWNVEVEVKPRCGRLVGFRADDYHGVRAVLSGRRCALAMWFTLDPYYREKAHTEARKILQKIKTASRRDG